MKILLDPIYTNDPSHCASNVKMKKIVQYTLQQRRDVFFYWMVPDWATEEDMKWYTQDEPLEKCPEFVRFIKYPYSKDRMREYIRVDKAYYDHVSFTGDLWDIDVVVTNRTSMVPFIKAMMVRPMADKLLWSRKVFLIEDMPLMDFKLHVPLLHPRTQTIQTLAGYLSADKTCVAAFWEKKMVLRDGGAYLSSSALSYIDKNMVEASPVYLDKPTLKQKSSIQSMLDGERPFTIAFIGRMTHNSRAEDIFEIIGKHWVMRGKGKVRGFISTQSKAAGRVKVPSWMEMHHLPREEFWSAVKTEIDCYVWLSAEEGYSMSFIEPLMMGCPAIVVKAPWSLSLAGADYPFFVANAMQAYVRVQEFYDNYSAAYKIFAKWQQSSFYALMQHRNEVYIPKLFAAFLLEWLADFRTWHRDSSGATNAIVKLIADWHKGKKNPLDIKSAIAALDKEGKLEHLAQKLDASFADRVKLVWQTDWNVYRLALMAQYGYVDCAVAPGTLRKPA